MREIRNLLVALAGTASLLSSGAAASDVPLADRVSALVASYPETIARAEAGMLIFRDGSPPLRIDDGRKRSHSAMLEEGDIEDSLSQIYPAGGCETRPERDFDPGRIRSDPLMRRLYGNSAKNVSESLVPVSWFGQTVQVTRRHGVDRALAAVRDELATDPALKKYLAPSAGTFNWRKVSGQQNLSVHSFGAAIDLNTRYADYWLWSGGKPGNVPNTRSRYPMKIVEVFERHGFIWGGRWYHYDTMHFEYRPELIRIGALAGVSACSDRR